MCRRYATSRPGYWRPSTGSTGWMRRSCTSTRPCGEIQLADGTVLDYDAAVLATGAIPNVPKLPGVTLQGVFTLRSRQDTAGIDSTLQQGVHPRGDRRQQLHRAGGGLGACTNAACMSPSSRRKRSRFARAVRAGDRRDVSPACMRRTASSSVLVPGSRRLKGPRTPPPCWSEGGERLLADLVVLGVGA